MISENMKNIVVGPELERTIDASLGEIILLLLKAHMDKVVQVDGETDEELRADVVLKRTIKLAKWLKNEGIGVGDNISINSENRLEFCIIPLATLVAGATFAPLNPDYAPLELKHVLSLSKPKMIFCSERTIDKMVGILPDHPYIKRLIVFGKERPKNNGAELEEVDEDFEATPLDVKETVATILCSSGDHGYAKGCHVHPRQHDCMHGCQQVRVAANELVEDVDPNDSVLGLVPFFHSFGFMLLFLNMLMGKKVVVITRFRPKPFLEAMKKHRVARLIVPPPVLLFLLKHPSVKDYDMSFIKEMRSGAAALGKDMERELKDRFKVRSVSQAYGMTETTFGIMLTPYQKGKVGSSGKLIPGMMAKVIDESGKALGPYEEGEVCLKGPMIMKGYVGDPGSTKAMIDKDGWLHTGDVGYYDSDEYFFIVDRIKELIKYKAFQVAPAELEALLLTHPAVQDAAVIGLPNEDAGELPLGFIVKKLGKEVTEREIEKFVADKVSPQKRLRGGVVFLEEIPRNPTGKILRRVLKERAIKITSKL
ncbi:hypothetical protein NQ318_019955 [Aromia moschata]|uniref:Firefly luciferase n=1 Tax=Aromia moschata TaxID=1265417 RepID=A0AAV8Y8F6_9CUCU|nr:hypothetical protein NQ318_019955 [Aromia moschata]